MEHQYRAQKIPKSISEDTDHNDNRTCNIHKRFFHDIKIEFLLHELKSPTSLVETALRSLLEAKTFYGDLLPKQEKTIRRALRNIIRMQGMLHDLLEIGQAESRCFFCSNFSPVQVAQQVLADALEVVQWHAEGGEDNNAAKGVDWHRHQINVSIDETAKDFVMAQDEKKFRQIVANLVINALHHRRQQMEMRLSVDRRVLFVKIIDDGPGIAAEHHHSIFERYAQVTDIPDLKRRGHGLGLAGARIVARCLGGDIHVESRKGEGATFILELPQHLEEGG
jgi:signal transduction histidine kinase